MRAHGGAEEADPDARDSSSSSSNNNNSNNTCDDSGNEVEDRGGPLGGFNAASDSCHLGAEIDFEGTTDEALPQWGVAAGAGELEFQGLTEVHV